MYIDQTGNFPHVSSQGNSFMMVLAHIDSYSIWVEPMKNITEGGLMLVRRRALQQMHAVGITPKRQVLDNEKSMAYRQEIMATEMTYQLVSPDRGELEVWKNLKKCKKYILLYFKNSIMYKIA